MGARLGQHFLKNKSAVGKIVAALDLSKEDTVIEIGPGKGALTFPLVNECKKISCRIVAVEKDHRLVSWLSSELVNWRRVVNVTRGDALKILPKLINQLTNQPINYKIIGNIPYYITGKLLRLLGGLEVKPKCIVLTIQKEVAHRLLARPPKMNLLSAAVQFWASVSLVASISKKDFSPPSKVDSAVIKIMPLKNYHAAHEKKYYQFIKIVFKQPRKTLFNNLRGGFKIKSEKIMTILSAFGLSGGERPQDLDVDALVKLSGFFN